MKKRTTMKSKGFLALSQMVILLVGIISIGYALGSEAGVVGAAEDVPVDGGSIPPDFPIPLPVVVSASKFAIDYVNENGKVTIPEIPPEEATKSLTLKSFFTDFSQAGVTGIAQGAAWAAIIAGGIKLLGPMITDNDAAVNAASAAAGLGIFSGKAVYSILAKKEGFEALGMGARGWGITAGIGVAAIVFLLMYKSEETEIVTFDCQPWDAPVGGNDCEKCNNQGILPCSEYQCRSLGQNCELVNAEDEEESKCVYVHRDDVKPPLITEWEGALTEDFEYQPETFKFPDAELRGAKILNKKSTSGCVKAFTPLSFGIKTDEPSRCKIDYQRKGKFEDMSFFFGGSSLFAYNHTQTMDLPSPSTSVNDSLIIQNDANVELFVRCMDANGNWNAGNFVFKFCVEEGPDTTAPLIVTTNLLNGMPVAYNQDSVDLKVYVNEPAECKWSPRDQAYEEMENQMSCSANVLEMNAQMLYRCSTTLTSLKNEQENNFYFRCKDQPGEEEQNRNVNRESYEFSVLGTRPLVVNTVGPNETVKDSTSTVKATLEVETFQGYKDGEATCYYSDTGDEESYVEFFETGTHEHMQDLYLPTGDYRYFIKCVDLGGNADYGDVEFRVESDSAAPFVVRALHYESYLRLTTDEEAECVYDTVDCNYAFEDGNEIRALDDGMEHYIDWKTDKSYYVKCSDEYGNKPLPNECSIIVKPFENY